MTRLTPEVLRHQEAAMPARFASYDVAVGASRNHLVERGSWGPGYGTTLCGRYPTVIFRGVRDSAAGEICKWCAAEADRRAL